jgi:CheY-like chemotaxis protein
VRLAQVFSNLVHNACKFTPDGGRISILAEREGEEAVIRVKDTGIGIEPKSLPRIFDMFAQPDGSVDREHGGLGLGLTLVRRLVEMHGGRVEAASGGRGKGAEFTVRLPALAVERKPAARAAERTSPPAPGPQPVPKRRVLVVDDNHDAAESTAAMLRLMGSDVRTAHDGLAAIDAAIEYRPDLVLLDLGMPKLNGYEAARRLRELPDFADVALVAVTGWGQEHDQRRSREAGFDRHMVKPVEPNALMNLLRTLPPRSTKASSA